MTLADKSGYKFINMFKKDLLDPIGISGVLLPDRQTVTGTVNGEIVSGLIPIMGEDVAHLMEVACATYLTLPEIAGKTSVYSVPQHEFGLFNPVDTDKFWNLDHNRIRDIIDYFSGKKADEKTYATGLIDYFKVGGYSYGNGKYHLKNFPDDSLFSASQTKIDLLHEYTLHEEDEVNSLVPYSFDDFNRFTSVISADNMKKLFANKESYDSICGIFHPRLINDYGVVTWDLFEKSWSGQYVSHAVEFYDKTVLKDDFTTVTTSGSGGSRKVVHIGRMRRASLVVLVYYEYANESEPFTKGYFTFSMNLNESISADANGISTAYIDIGDVVDVAKSKFEQNIAQISSYDNVLLMLPGIGGRVGETMLLCVSR